MADNTNTQTADGWTHLNNLEILNNSVIQGNLTVLGAINGSEDNFFTITAISTVGAGVLTAAGLIGGAILRTGPVAAFSDTTATAAQIYSALGSPAVNTTVRTIIKNATAFTQTLIGGVGVTLPATVIVPAYSVAEYVITINSATAVTLAHLSTNPLATGTNSTASAIATLSTVGAGTIPAASFNGGLIQRSGSQSGSPFTDTTDTAAAIIAACANLVNKIGTSMFVDYSNTTNATATVTGGTGVTVSGVTAIPAGMVVRYLVTYTAAATLTMASFSVSNNLSTLTSPSVTGNLTLSSTSFIIGSSADGIIAHAGGGSGSATQLAASLNRISTCATDHDSVKLPVALGGVEIAIDNDGAKIMDIYPSGSDTIEDGAGPVSILSGADVTLVCPVTGKWYLQGTSSATSIPVGSALTVASFMAGSTMLLNTAAGSTATLPAATGTGNIYRFAVTTTATSNAHKILAASVSDFLIGNATGHVAAGTTLSFSAAAATAHSIQMPFAGTQPSGGFIGDWYEFTDAATNLWTVKGAYLSGTTSTTPFSSATS